MLSGVRISCDIDARKCDLASLAAWALINSASLAINFFASLETAKGCEGMEGGGYNCAAGLAGSVFYLVPVYLT
jgi:hypothetical protein